MAIDRTTRPKDAELHDQLSKVLVALGQELLPEDAVVAEAFLGTGRHVGVEDLRRMLEAEHPGLDVSHIRRTMRLLTAIGIAQRVELDDRVVYEHLHLGDHHDHLVCVRCGRIEEFASATIEEEQFEACRRLGFQPLFHTLVVRGICAKCAGKLPPTRLLASCLAGETVEIVEIVGGHGITHRLMALGLVRGTEVQVLSNEGTVVLDVRGSRIAIGHGQAQKVVVRGPQQENTARGQDAE
jgi:Fur family ferric uptake transcriptional regulator